MAARTSSTSAKSSPQKLVIVESPAKAATISRFLGKDYRVEASYGHVRDLPQNANEIPAAVRKEPWARLGVNLENHFDPVYVVPADKKKHVKRLKDALKDSDLLLLATDEDREGESISWHVLELLKPGKGVDVQRIVFHEVTPEAIQKALASPRQLDENLVRAQEARRVLDRLYGYSLSPLLWKRVAPGLSAGRVQSVAVRLLVEKERERIAFRSAEYGDLKRGASRPACCGSATAVWPTARASTRRRGAWPTGSGCFWGRSRRGGSPANRPRRGPGRSAPSTASPAPSTRRRPSSLRPCSRRPTASCGSPRGAP
jgi:DNA topoisomerase IA